ncbi:MAG: hypothetical protein O7H41_12940 [Planctomycetota bacterium]|nr:hypothetical protein [Planctomycetota bacterium]
MTEPVDVNEIAVGIHKLELEILHTQLNADLQETRRTEQIVIVGCGAIFTWLISNLDKPDVSKWAWGIPFLLAILGAVRASSILARINKASQYITQVEKTLPRLPGIEGWRTFFAEHGRKTALGAVIITWLFILLGSLLAPLLLKVWTEPYQIGIIVFGAVNLVVWAGISIRRA